MNTRNYCRSRDSNTDGSNPCPKCNKYIVGLDLRRKNNISTELAALSMVHLDAIAQQKGYLPIAECAWNIIVPNIQTTSNQ